MGRSKSCWLMTVKLVDCGKGEVLVLYWGDLAAGESLRNERPGPLWIFGTFRSTHATRSTPPPLADFESLQVGKDMRTAHDMKRAQGRFLMGVQKVAVIRLKCTLQLLLRACLMETH